MKTVFMYVRRELCGAREAKWRAGEVGHPMAVKDMRANGPRKAMFFTAASLLTGGSLLVSACSTAGAEAAGNERVVQVAAAENFWGSIARQLGGAHAHVISIIANPNTDPHSYEPTAADARAVASARLVMRTASATTRGWSGSSPPTRASTSRFSRWAPRCACQRTETLTAGSTRLTCARLSAG